MASSLGEAVLEIVADYSKMKEDIEKAGDHALKKMGEFGDKMKNVGSNMTAAITLPFIGLGAVAVDAASNLAESGNAVNVVFGESADIMHEFGKSAAENVGLAESEFNQLGAVTGSFLKNLGFDQEAAAKETINLTERAADMASIFNTDVDQALQAIQSGLKGEFNPLEQFGVKMNAAAIEAKALEMGLADQNGELDDNAKAQAALALIYEQTNALAGDFKNTSDGLANSMRITKAQFTDAAANLGTQLLPYVLQAVQYISQLIAKFQGLSPEQQKMILLFAGAAAAIGPILMIVGSLITALSAIIPVIGAVGAALSPFLLPILAIIAAIGLLYLAWTNNWGGIQEKVQAVVAYLQPLFQQFIQNLVGLWQNVLLPALQAVWGWMNSTLFPFLQAIANFLGAVFGVAITAVAGIWQNVLYPAMVRFIEWADQHIMPVLRPIADFLMNVLGKAFEWLSEKIAGVTEWLNNMAAKLNSMSLPDWMTPGSPTPWEIGLLGVEDALKSLSGAALPSLSAGLGAMPAPAVAGGVSVGGGGMGGMQFVYSPMISTADEYEARRVLGPFIEGKVREMSKR